MTNLLKLTASVSVSVLFLASCASQPPAVTFAEVSADNEARKVEYNRIQVDFDADCNEDGCLISEDTLDRLVKIISGMNDEIELRVNAYNLSLDSLSHCQYAYSTLDRALAISEDRIQKLDLTSQVKQLVTFAGCGALLWAK